MWNRLVKMVRSRYELSISKKSFLIFEKARNQQIPHSIPWSNYWNKAKIEEKRHALIIHYDVCYTFNKRIWNQSKYTRRVLYIRISFCRWFACNVRSTRLRALSASTSLIKTITWSASRNSSRLKCRSCTRKGQTTAYSQK